MRSTESRRPGNQDTILIVLGLFGTAAITGVLAIIFGAIDTLAFPVLLLLCPVVVILGVVAALQASSIASIYVAAAALCFIDFGFGAFQPIILGIKGSLYGLCFIIGLRFVLANRQLLRAIDVALLAYVLFAWCTVSYSLDRTTSLYTGFGLVSLGLIAIKTSFENSQALDRYIFITGSALGLAMLLSLAFYAAFPGLAIATRVAGEGRVSGLFGSPNSAGGVAGLALLLNFTIVIWPPTQWPKARILSGATCLLAGAALFLSGSRNSMFAAFIAGTLLVGLRWPICALTSLGATLLGLFAVTLSGAWKPLVEFSVSLLSRQRNGFDVQNLTGRTEIWSFVLEQWRQSPVVGFGLGSTRKVISEGWSTFWGQTTGSAHNALLESLLDLGIVGTTILAILFLFVVRGAVTNVVVGRAASASRNLPIIILLYILSFGVAEKSFAGTPSAATGALFLAWSLIAFQLRFNRTNRRDVDTSRLGATERFVRPDR